MQQQIPLDAAVANRFISSLSKSLQALCHGCMDFENGIEIVGFINVNIDSGSKVDYVLNEKVQKSTNNSMTFVSNSFLATKKDQPKPTRDESCSPVPELMNTFPSNQQTSSYQYPHQRENLYSPTKPQSLRGKRSWSGADRPSRGTPQKQSRGGGRVSVTHGNSYNNTPSASAPSSEFLTTHHQQNDTPVVSHSGDNNVKQEPFDNEFAASGSGIIKGDPDASPEASSATGQTDNFLSKSSEADPNNAQGDQLPVSFSADNPYESSESRDNDQSFMSVAGPSHQAQSHSEPDYDRGEFDDQEEQEGDVIEIGDDDEDINEMFGHSGNKIGWSKKSKKKDPTISNAANECDTYKTGKAALELEVVWEDFRYFKRKNNEDNTEWCCSLRSCSACLVTSNDSVIAVMGDHNHDPQDLIVVQETRKRGPYKKTINKTEKKESTPKKIRTVKVIHESVKTELNNYIPPVRKFQENWKIGRPWLEVRECGMVCLFCEKYEVSLSLENKLHSRQFLDGCKSYKKESVTSHEKSKAHFSAERKEKEEIDPLTYFQTNCLS